ncbi:MAG TPA: 3-carboxy-cis,cis-muconate cycloisomerase [Chthoniobacterales bacterium]|jgi:3-carboxy-cis,cis-muconate cycloisomerase|nr:3-carboxy-cis,cis-muconate cycloisomerase [Chthoniobacterales bacterium]
MFDALFIDSDVENLFTDKAIIQAMLRFEAGLALAQADANVISFDHAHLIARVCENAEIDLEKIILAAKQAGNPAIPLVKELTILVRKTDAYAAGLVHAGATSQDLIDTATMLQLKAALSKLYLGLTRLQRRLTELIKEHRETVMIGRTLLQQARPISFAFKLAGWLDQLIRCRDRLREVRARALVLQFGGAVGTLAASERDALTIMSRLAERLELGEPTMPWHTARDRLFEVASALAMLSGCLGKIATDASLLMQTEVDEISEAAKEGRGGSSAMPHKRNPVAPTMIVAACSRVPGLLATICASMMQEHERSVGRWHAEWNPLPEMVCLTGGAIKHAGDLFSRLEVNVTRMRQNIEVTRGLVFAESMVVALRKEIGKSEAEEVVKLACQRAREKDCHLHKVLSQDPTISRVLHQSTLEQIFRPENALGIANELIDRVLMRDADDEPGNE